jgi:hypothetical protein
MAIADTDVYTEQRSVLKFIFILSRKRRAHPLLDRVPILGCISREINASIRYKFGIAHHLRLR